MDSRKQSEMLVLRCQIGDRQAFQELFEAYQPRLRYYIKRLDEKDSDTDDTLQEIWLTVLRKIRKLKNPKAFPIWLYRIARNKVYGRFRSKQLLSRLPVEEIPAKNPEDELRFSSHSAVEIHKALKSVHARHREVLTLFFLEEMSYQAIAEVVGCNIGTVKSRIYYAKQSLRKEMESDHG